MRFLGILFCLVLVSAGSFVCADVAPPSTDGWSLVPVTNGTDVQLVLAIDNADALAAYDGIVSKTWGDPTLFHENKFVSLGGGGSLGYLKVSVDGDPQVSWEFKCVAGPSATSFTFISAVVPFATINNAKGTATAAVTVTDCDGNGASAIGAFNGGFYRAVYNTMTAPVDFCQLIPGAVNAIPYGSATASGAVPPWQPIGVPVSDISAQFSFRLSANDSASGTSSFTVIPVPEPGSMLAMMSGIIGLAGFAIRRKRH